MPHYVWQTEKWPNVRWSAERVIAPLAWVRVCQGKLLGKAAGLGFDLDLKLRAEVLTEEAVETAAIEGESLDRDSVRSSVARRLGLPAAGLRRADRHVEGLVEMLMDATRRHGEPLTADRLKGWHAALFPTGFSGIRPIRVGDWRIGPEPMQVVSGPMGRERVHYEAPPAGRVQSEMKCFLEWWASRESPIDGLLRAALAHFWFVTIHPFDDGNGRIGRAIADMALAQDEGSSSRFYSMSAQISADRDPYYTVLERTQRGDGDVTDWLLWFLECLGNSVDRSEKQLEQSLQKARFWQRHARLELDERQLKVINRLLDAGPGGFEGSVTTRKYVGMTKASRATAQREISDLVQKGLLRKGPGRGRSSSYELVWEQQRS